MTLLLPFKNITRKIVALSLLLFAFAAQAQDHPSKSGAVKLDKNINIISFDQITVYQYANRGGASGKISYLAGKFSVPFSPAKSVCVEVASGKIAYLKFSQDLPYERAFSGIENNVDLTYLCGVRFDDLTAFAVHFNGISTNIHNNDCRKVFGKITIKVVETSPQNVNCYFKANTGTATKGQDVLTFMPFNKSSANAPDDYNNAIFNNNPVPVLSSTVTLKSGGEDYSGFQVGKAALRDGRIRIYATIYISTAHKANDVSNDYGSNVHMSSPVVEVIPINLLYADGKLVNAETPRFICGPYEVSGRPDSPNMRYATEYSEIRKTFRAHFTLSNL